MAKIIPPRELGDKDLRRFVSAWNPRTWQIHQRQHVDLDLSSTEFLAPWALCLYAQYMLFLREAHFNTVALTVNPDTRVGRYAIISGLGELLSPGKYPMPTTIDRNMAPLRRI